MKNSSSSWALFVAAAVVAIGLVGLAVYQKRAPSPYDGFAQCLRDKDVRMFGTWWCPNCARQKEVFGNAFRYIKYKECSPAQQKSFALCQNDNITGVPTWEFSDGSRLQGVQSVETLSEKSGCSLDASSSTPSVVAPSEPQTTTITPGVTVEAQTAEGLTITDVGVETAP